MKLTIKAVPVSLALYLSIPTVAAFAAPQPLQGHQGAQITPPPYVQAVRDEEKHRETLREESETSTSRVSAWGPRVWWNKMKHKWNKESKWAENKKRIDAQLGGFQTSLHVYDITTCAAQLIEKHYADTASFKMGASFLHDMQEVMLAWNSNRDYRLEEIKAQCNKSLEGYKLEKKAKKIERTKVFTDEQRHNLDEYISTMFANSPEMIPLLQRAYESTLDCHNPKGMTVGVAFGLGGYGGVYRQKCKSPLGQRYTIYRLHGGPSVGFGGVGTMTFLGLNFTRDLKEPNQSSTFHIRGNGHAAGALVVGAGIDSSVPVGVIKKVGQTEEDRRNNISQPSVVAGSATGAGVYAGAGLEFDYRSKLNKPDYDELFKALRLYK